MKIEKEEVPFLPGTSSLFKNIFHFQVFVLPIRHKPVYCCI